MIKEEREDTCCMLISDHDLSIGFFRLWVQQYPVRGKRHEKWNYTLSMEH